MNVETGPFRIRKGRVGCVLIHGFTATPWTIKELATFLADADISVSCPLLPGHGTTLESLENVTWNSWVETALEEVLVLKKSTDHLFLIGHSMGGAIALLAANQCDVDGVILLSTPIRSMDWRLRFLSVLKPFIRSWKKRRRPDKRNLPDGVEYDRYPLKGVAQCLSMLRELRRHIEDVKYPVLILHGEGDRRVSVENAHWIYDHISTDKKEKIIIDDDRHLITIGSEKERVKGEVLRFIQTVSRDRQ